jgi:nicotinate-nucleotide adenylyltransferase
MEHWINIDGILSEFKIIVLGRNGLDINGLIEDNPVLRKHKGSFVVCDDFNMMISSTSFRESMDQDMVPKKVYDYINDNDLYQGDEDDRV